MSNKFREAFKELVCPTEHAVGSMRAAVDDPRRKVVFAVRLTAAYRDSQNQRREEKPNEIRDRCRRATRLRDLRFVRNLIVEQRAIVESDSPPLVDANETFSVRISRDEIVHFDTSAKTDCTNDRRPAANGKHSSKRSTSLNGGQVSSSIATLGCTSALDRASSNSSNNNVFLVGIHTTKNHRPPFKTVTLG